MYITQAFDKIAKGRNVGNTNVKYLLRIGSDGVTSCRWIADTLNDGYTFPGNLLFRMPWARFELCNFIIEKGRFNFLVFHSRFSDFGTV